MTSEKKLITDLTGTLATVIITSIGFNLSPGIASTFLTGLEINLSSSIIQKIAKTIKNKWLNSSDGLPNNNLQLAIYRAFENAIESMRTQYFKTPIGNNLAENEKESINCFFNELKANFQTGLAATIKNKNFDDIITGDEKQIRQELLTEIKNNSTFDTYNDHFSEFFRKNIESVVEIFFCEELKKDSTESNKAWRAYQKYLLEGIYAVLKENKNNNDELANVNKILNEIKSKLDSNINSGRNGNDPFQKEFTHAFNCVKYGILDSNNKLDFIIKILTETSTEYVNYIAKIKNDIDNKLKEIEDNIFVLNIAFCNSYQQILKTHITKEKMVYNFSLESFFKVDEHQVFYIHAPGGSGKTVLMYRTVQKAIEKNIIPIYFTLKKFRKEKIERLNNSTTKNLVETIFDINKHLSYEKLNKFQSSTKILFIFDGVNETDVKPEIIFTIIDYLRRTIETCTFLITDRMLNREKKLDKLKDNLQYVTITSINEETIAQEIKNKIDKQSSNFQAVLLKNPLILSLFLKLNNKIDNTEYNNLTNVIKNYIMKMFTNQNIKFEDETQFNALLRKTGKIAIKAYESKHRSLRMDFNWWITNIYTIVNKGTIDLHKALKESGLIIETIENEEKFIEFSHQLFHDFFVACHFVALEQNQWTKNLFDSITFNAKSFDILEIILELINNKNEAKTEAEDLVLEIYDWNYQATFQCILFLSSNTEIINKNLQNAIFAMTALKKFDRFEHTSQNAIENIGLINEITDIRFNKDSIDQLISEINTQYKTQNDHELYKKWKNIFTKNTNADIGDLPSLTGKSILGWTAANIFKRVNFAKGIDIEKYLIALYHSYNYIKKDYAPNIKWRIVHLLGGFNKSEFIELLKKVISGQDPEDKWVRFGAVRSLVEIASNTDKATSTEILKWLTNKLTNIKEKHVRAELRNTAILNGTPPVWWKAEYLNLLDAGEKNDEDTSEQQLWSDRKEKLTKQV